MYHQVDSSGFEGIGSDYYVAVYRVGFLPRSPRVGVNVGNGGSHLSDAEQHRWSTPDILSECELLQRLYFQYQQFRFCKAQRELPAVLTWHAKVMLGFLQVFPAL